MKRIISLILCVILISCSFSLVSTADATANGGTVVNLGIPLGNTYTDTNPSAYARSVWGMENYEGKIYIGGGEYNVNAGSTVTDPPVYSYDPATGTWTKEYAVNDEQISRFYVVNDTLYIAGMDPGEGAGTNGFYYYKQNGTWKSYTSVPYGTHMFDMLFTDGGKTVFAGLGTAEGVSARIAKSTDGGKT